MEIPSIIECIVCGVHIQTEIHKHGIQFHCFLLCLRNYAVQVHFLGIIPLMVISVTLIGILDSGIEKCLPVILVFPTEYDRALDCSGSIVVVVDHRMLPVVAVLGPLCPVFWSSSTELAVDKQIVEHTCIGVS